MWFIKNDVFQTKTFLQQDQTYACLFCFDIHQIYHFLWNGYLPLYYIHKHISFINKKSTVYINIM